MTIYIALLRGINVGGKNKIKMADLKKALGALGLAQIQTYIQSGNVLFESDEDEVSLRQQIEQKIEKVFGLSIKVIIRTSEELKRIVASCPFSEEQIAEAEVTSKGECLYLSMLLQVPQDDQLEKLKSLDAKGDQYRIIERNIFLLFRKSIRNSKLAKEVEKLGVTATVRNWKTVNKLAAMSNEMERKTI